MKEQIPDITYRRLNDNETLTDDQMLSLSNLVYDTDPTIYPALFIDRTNAVNLLPRLFRAKDTMFRLSNCYIAAHEDDIIGLILWISEGFTWSSALMKQEAVKSNIPLSPYLDAVEKEYICKYEGTDKGIISIVNVCVCRRFQGKGIGRAMLTNFMAECHGKEYHLGVLEENTAAIHLYKSAGFEICERYNGFTVDHSPLPVLSMKKRGGE